MRNRAYLEVRDLKSWCKTYPGKIGHLWVTVMSHLVFYIYEWAIPCWEFQCISGGGPSTFLHLYGNNIIHCWHYYHYVLLFWLYVLAFVIISSQCFMTPTCFMAQPDMSIWFARYWWDPALQTFLFNLLKVVCLTTLQ